MAGELGRSGLAFRGLTRRPSLAGSDVPASDWGTATCDASRAIAG